MNYRYHCMPMHLHCSHEPKASMESHMYNAQKLGMRYIRFTEHDVRMGRKKYFFDHFDFSRGTLEYEDYPKNIVRLDPVGNVSWRFVEGALELSAEEEGGVSLYTTGKRHTMPLTADVTLTVGVSCERAVGEVLVDVKLSQRPPEHRNAHQIYRLDPSQHTHVLHLSADVPEALGGLDNALTGVSLIVKGGAVARFDRLEITFVHGFHENLRRQRELAERVGERYGIKPFVTFEISGAGQHKNCFSTSVPVIDYEARGYHVTAEEAAAHVREHGGIFSYNHPLTRYARADMTPELSAELLERAAAELISNKAEGASLIEVGFPRGRAGFTLEQHLALWDRLSLAGIFITGEGDSDSHASDTGWFSGNNFASWTAAEAELPDPVPEEAFIRSMKAGRLYAGNPVYLQDVELSFTCEGKPMGAIIPVEDASARQVTFRVKGAGEGWLLQLIVDGRAAKRVAVSGSLTQSFDVRPRRVVSFARAELYNADGQMVMFTNPIYFVKAAELTGELPAERLYPDQPRIFITRHGQAACREDYPDAMFPPGDPPLSPLGREQAALLGERLRGEGFHGHIICSPYIRTLETAQVIAGIVDAPIYPYAPVREIMQSEETARRFRGLTIEEIKARFPRVAPDAELAHPWWTPRVEPPPEVYARVDEGVRTLGEPSEDRLYVGHGASCNGLIRSYELPGRMMYNCALCCVEPPFSGDTAHLPYEKTTNNFRSREQMDAERFEKPYEKEIALPEELDRICGRRLLHIGDTHSDDYPFYRRLIELTRPDFILHTGDMADEVKVGRIPGTEYEYLSKVRVLLDIMRASGAKLIITPGNNDLPEELARLAPEAQIVPTNRLLNLGGRDFRVGHDVAKMIYDCPYTFYGHGLTSETRRFEDNRVGEPQRFNALWGSFLYAIDEDRVLRLPRGKV